MEPETVDDELLCPTEANGLCCKDSLSATRELFFFCWQSTIVDEDFVVCKKRFLDDEGDEVEPSSTTGLGIDVMCEGTMCGPSLEQAGLLPTGSARFATGPKGVAEIDVGLVFLQNPWDFSFDWPVTADRRPLELVLP